MQLRTVCDKRLYVPITSGSFDAKISIDIQQTFNLFCNNVSIIENTIFATDFLRFFFRDISKKRKKSFFWNLKKNEKYVFSNTAHCRAMHYSAKRGTEIACRLSVCNDDGSGSHTLEILETNCTDN